MAHHTTFSPADQYYVYEFLHQPSHEECIKMSESSPSTPFRRYTDVYYRNYERFFSDLFSDCELTVNCLEWSQACVCGLTCFYLLQCLSITAITTSLTRTGKASGLQWMLPWQAESTSVLGGRHDAATTTSKASSGVRGDKAVHPPGHPLLSRG